MIPRGPRFKIELVSSRSREHCERHNSFSCSEKTVACRCAASYRRGLVSAAAARPLPRRPSPTRKPWADSSSPGTHAAAKKTLFNFPPPLGSAPPRHLVAPQPNKVRWGWSLPPADRRGEQKETRAGAGEVHPRRLPVVSSILYVQHYNLRAIVQTGRTPTTFCSFRLAEPTNRFVVERGPWMGLGKAAGKVRLKLENRRGKHCLIILKYL
ncbi:uncharacterized protein LOC118894778 isoform X2 [Balaenoptera musculus]|uniref:Uncharacterized protein LOC118894778 isoform X2 n=1 Tax=Balaenoptera musculus TaxID=9771 RepID=A0A8B8XCD2_BALMU|nr:uncharacterized protein LOC118894778 isoform X2 [Balaenoptera musculus]